MTETQFLEQLDRVRKSYKWVKTGKGIVGVARNGNNRHMAYNPVTALCRTARKGTFSLTQTNQAAKEIGLSKRTVNALLSSDNVGYSQVIKGKISKVLA